MQIQIALPDDVAHSLKEKWGSLERKLLVLGGANKPMV